MTAYVALLRAINVGGHANVGMADLRALFQALGFAEVRTVLQSGNVVFRDDDRTGAELEALLEPEAVRRLDLNTDFLVRTAAEMAAIVAANPFPDQAAGDPGHLVVMFLKDAPGSEAVEALRLAIKGREVVRAGVRELYIVYTDGIGRSKLTNGLIETKLGTRSTGRNWNTVLKLSEMTAASGGAAGMEA